MGLVGVKRLLLGHKRTNQSLYQSLPCCEFRSEEKKREKKIGDGIDGGGSVLESGWDDLHHLLKHLCESREELSQRAFQS